MHNLYTVNKFWGVDWRVITILERQPPYVRHEFGMGHIGGRFEHWIRNQNSGKQLVEQSYRTDQ